MKTLVPSKKRINPYRVARQLGLTLVLWAAAFFLGVWPWWYVVTADPGSPDFGVAAVFIIVIQWIALLAAIFFAGPAVLESLARRWHAQEAAWDEVNDR